MIEEIEYYYYYYYLFLYSSMQAFIGRHNIDIYMVAPSIGDGIGTSPMICKCGGGHKAPLRGGRSVKRISHGSHA